MRYGVVRPSPDLPPASVQRRRIEMAGSDVIVADGAHRLWAARPLLAPGDEILVYALEAFGLTTGELARLLRRLLEIGVTLRIVGGSQGETLTPEGGVPRALALLADYEARHPRAVGERRRGRATGSPLTQHQLKFARQMHRRGHSMRAIGLIFQQSPTEMAALLRETAEEGEDDGALPEPPDARTGPTPP
ncbi:MAG: hypothetical protein JNK30_06395 [Phenylobacterium sp.]|nr:hypothetical protein [Phenylobacterium sp.]